MKNRKGFTLAELLIVVAIIAVLVGISIPVFTSQLEKSREATDLANVRSAYAEMMVAVLDGDKLAKYSMDDKQTFYLDEDNQYSVIIDLKQKEEGWRSKLPLSVAGVESSSNNDGDNGIDWLNTPNANGKCILTYSIDDNKLIIDWSGKGASLTNKSLFGSTDFGGYVNATWQGKGTGIKNTNTSDDWYKKSRSTKQLVELDNNSSYLISYTIPAGYAGNTISVGTLLFKSTDATDSLENVKLNNGQAADSGWISSDTNSDLAKYNYQVVTVNKDGSKTITQTINTDDSHVYFGANFYTGKTLSENEKNVLEKLIDGMTITKAK